MFAAIDLQVALIALVCLTAGTGLGVLTWWFWRSAQPESPALAALEIMSERRYAQADDEERARILDDVRLDPTAVAPLAKRATKARDDEPRDPQDEDLYEEWTDLGPIDPLLRR